MSCESRSEYISVQKRRYRRAGKAHKTRLLDEVCEVCGYERKYAVKLLNGALNASIGKQGRRSEYDDPELVRALRSSGLLCGKTAQAGLAALAEALWKTPWEAVA